MHVIERLIMSLTVVADAVGYKISEAMLGMYVDGISRKIDPEEASEALLRILENVSPTDKNFSNSASTRFPSIKEIIQEAKKPGSFAEDPIAKRKQIAETDDAQAREAASRIVSAVAKYGYTNPDRAEKHVGQLGWKVVCLQGGWERVCRMLSDANSGMLQAQWRDLAKSQITRHRDGTFDQPPGLPIGEGFAGELVAEICGGLPAIENRLKTAQTEKLTHLKLVSSTEVFKNQKNASESNLGEKNEPP